MALAGSGERRRPGYEVMVRVDFDTLLRGYALDGETCEVTGFGTVTPQVVADIIATEDPFLKTVVTKGKDVVGVAHLGRVPNAYQRSALDWLYPACAVQGCPTRAQFLQSDHRAEWSRTHYTVLDLLDRLCPRHHRQKTTEGWALVKGTGKRAFVGPTDPRHPGPCPAPTYPGAPPPGGANTSTARTGATRAPPARPRHVTGGPRRPVRPRLTLGLALPHPRAKMTVQMTPGRRRDRGGHNTKLQRGRRLGAGQGRHLSLALPGNWGVPHRKRPSKQLSMQQAGPDQTKHVPCAH